MNKFDCKREVGYPCAATAAPAQNRSTRRSAATVRSVALALVLGLTACASHRAEVSQRDMRCTLMTLTEDQVLDNLVRLNKGLPILHIDYTNLNALVTDTAGASTADFGYTSVDNVFKFVDGVAIPDNDSFVGSGSRTTAAKGATSATLATALTFQGNPVIGKSLVYAAYLDYLNLRDGQMTSTRARRFSKGTMRALMPLEFSPTPMPEGEYILQRPYARGWWYIPVEYVIEFRALGLAANGLSRDVTPPKQYPISIKDYHRLAQQPVAGEYVYLVRLSAVVPSRSGGFGAKLNITGGRPEQFATEPAIQNSIIEWSGKSLKGSSVVMQRAIERRPTSLAEPTDEVILRFSEGIVPSNVSPDAIVQELMTLREGINLRIGGAAPYVPTATEELLKSINDKLQQQLHQPR